MQINDYLSLVSLLENDVKAFSIKCSVSVSGTCKLLSVVPDNILHMLSQKSNAISWFSAGTRHEMWFSTPTSTSKLIKQKKAWSFRFLLNAPIKHEWLCKKWSESVLNNWLIHLGSNNFKQLLPVAMNWTKVQGQFWTIAQLLYS